MFRSYPVYNRLYRTIDKLHKQYQDGHDDQQNTLGPIDIKPEYDRQDYQCQQRLLTKGGFMAQCSPDAIKGVNSRKPNSLETRILLHAMITLLHAQATGSAEHNVVRHLRGKRHVVRVALILPVTVFSFTALAQTPAPLVALASSFRGPWPELMQAYRSETGQAEPRTSFASSGLLTTQIRHGAPFELYLSADQTTVQQLQALGKTREPSITLARGTLSLVWQAMASDSDSQNTSGGADAVTTGLDSLAMKLEKAEAFKLAIPNPRHAPYGIAARQALESAGLWPLPSGYLLNAENAAQTLQFALSGAVDYAIVPDTLVFQIPDTLQKMPLAPGSYDTVVHQMVLLDAAGENAQSLFDWLQADTAATILTRFGLAPEH